MKILGNGRIFLEKGEQFPLVCPKCTGYVEFTDAPVVKPKALEWYLLILDGVPGKLDLQIGSHACRFGCRFGQSCAHADDGKLRAARHLKHVKIAVAVPRIKRLHRYRNQKIALSGVANAFASRSMADAVGLFQRVRHVIRESGLLENPLTICLGEGGTRQKQEGDQEFHFSTHGLFLVLDGHGQN